MKPGWEGKKARAPLTRRARRDVAECRADKGCSSRPLCSVRRVAQVRARDVQTSEVIDFGVAQEPHPTSAFPAGCSLPWPH